MFNQRVRRALHRTGPAEAAQYAARQRRLAGSEVARERNDHARHQRSCQRSPRTLGGKRIIEQQVD